MKDFLKDLFFPRVCLGCGFLGSHICPSCEKKIKKVQKDWCFYCKQPSFLGLTHPKCQKGGVDGVVTAFYYNDVLKRIVKNIKYRLVREGLKDFFLLIPQETYAKLDRYNKLYRDTLLMPIPLSSKRKRQRGFNQSEELVNHIMQFLSFSRAKNLIKIHDTKSQSQTMSHAERKKNIKGAFAVEDGEEISGRVIVLVDDVVTTGATVAEAVRVLKKQGAAKVFVFAIAKG